MEPSPPAGVEAVEWLLLTSEPADRTGDVERVAGWHSCRWMIEAFRRVQKSGPGVERYHLRTAAGTSAPVAVRSAMAVPRMNLRRAARDPAPPARPAEAVVPREWVAVLGRMPGRNPAG